MKSFHQKLVCCIAPLLLTLAGVNGEMHEMEDMALQIGNVTVELSSGSMTLGPDGSGTSSASPQGDDFEITLSAFGFFSQEFLNYTWDEHMLWNGPDNLDGTNETISYFGYVASEEVPDACYAFDPSSHLMFMNRTVMEEGWTRTCWIFSTGDVELNEQLHEIIVSMLWNDSMIDGAGDDNVTTVVPPTEGEDEDEEEVEGDSAMALNSMMGAILSSVALLFAVAMF